MDWTRCPRTHHAVHEALALARALSQKISKEEEEEEEEKSERERETKDVVVKECTKRLRLLSTQLRRLELPSFAEPEVTLAKRESERSGRKGDSKNNLDDLRNFSRSLLDSSSSLLGERERERELNTRASASASASSTSTTTVIPSFRPSGGKLGKEKEVLLHQQLHEDLSEEILEMARGLKQNTVKFKDKLEENAKALDEAEETLETNVAKVKRRNKQANVFYKRNWSTSCYSYIILFWVALVFTLMYVFLKVTSFAGYSSSSSSESASAKEL